VTRDRWHRIRELFLAVADLSPDERRKVLDRECRDDPDLELEVLSLLEAEREPPSILDSLEETFGGIPLETTSSGPLSGLRIGSYRIREELGRGGMGTVYRAEDQGNGQTVALKVMRDSLASPGNVRRFLLERRVLGQLHHPGIARVVDGGVTRDGSPWFAMELVPGTRIDRFCDARRLSVSDRLALFREVLEAVGHAHRCGVIHRDLKPSNILVDSDGRPKLIDFGIAKLLEDDGVTGEGTLTRTGVRVMTPEYAAPEQVLGGEVVPATDVHALGAILYELMTGRRPRSFEGLSLSEVERAIRDTDPPMPSAVVEGESAKARLRRTDPEGLRRQLTGGLEAIVMRALERDPARRYPTTDALAKDLDRLGKDGRVSLDAVPAGRRSTGSPTSGAAVPWGKGWSPGHVGLAILSVAVAVGGAATVWTAISGGSESPPAPVPVTTNRIAILPFVYRGSESWEYLAEGLVDLLSSNLNGIRGLQAVDPRALFGALPEADPGPLTALEGRDAALRLGAGMFVSGSIVEAGGMLRIAGELHRLDADGGQVPTLVAVEGSAEELFELVDRLTAGIVERLATGPGARLTGTATRTTHSLTALRAYLEGEHHLRSGRFPMAFEVFERAVSEDPSFALAHFRLSNAANWLNRDGVARASARAAVQHGDRLSPPDRLLVTAWDRYLRGDPLEAERLYREILAAYPQHVEAWLMLGEVQFHWMPALGRSLSASRASFERVLTFEPGHVGALLHLARIAASERRWADLDSIAQVVLALEPEEIQALEIRSLRAFGLEDEGARGAVLRELAERSDDQLWWLLGRMAAHLDAPGRVLQVAELMTAPHRDPTWRAYGYLMQAQLEAARGRWSAAENALDRVRELRPGWAAQYRAAYSVIPELSLPPGRLLAFAEDLERIRHTDPGEDGMPGPNRPIFLPRGDYSLALLALRAGKPDEATRRIARLDEPYPSVEENRWGPHLARQLRAEVAAAEGRPREALAVLGPPGPSPDSTMLRLAAYSEADARMLRARLLAELGREEEAVRWLSTFPDPAAHDLAYLAPSHLRRAEIHRARGEDRQARAHYARFLELWDEADPEVQPLVRQVRDRLEERTPSRR
jgi:serine/threonine protein kinase/tetratricopeptide (TPR) repeat protein